MYHLKTSFAMAIPVSYNLEKYMSNYHGSAEEEYRTLLLAIIRQAMDDYIKLQHPKYRRKKYLQEAFDSAIGVFFDSSYRFLYLKNDDGESMSIENLLSHFISSGKMDLETLRNHVITEAKLFWENKLLNVIDIPESFIYDGHVYSTFHTDEEDYQINYEKKAILLNKDSSNSENQQNFIKAAVEIMLYHEEIPMSKTKIENLGRAFFRMIKVNSCFLES